MKNEYSLEKVLASESPELIERVNEKYRKLREEYILTRIREDLNMSQTELASAVGVSRPAITKMETAKVNVGIMTLKKYIEALGGKLSLQVQMPMGELRTYQI